VSKFIGIYLELFKSLVETQKFGSFLLINSFHFLFNKNQPKLKNILSIIFLLQILFDKKKKHI